jgi:uncharacterized protein YcbX
MSARTETPTIAWISIAPVKAMAMQSLTEAEITTAGIPGDRRFAVLDAEGRLVNGKRIGPLATIRPEISPDGGRLALVFPDGTRTEAPVERDGQVEGRFFGRPRAAHRLRGPFDDALSAWARSPIRLVELDRPGDGVDRAELGAAISLADVAALAELAYAGGLDEPLDARRFRMTLGITSVRAWAEDAWLERDVVVGDAVVRPAGNVGRCAVTTHDPDTGRADVDTLGLLARIRGDLATSEPLAFGVWATVVQPGRVRLGDRVEVR